MKDKILGSFAAILLVGYMSLPSGTSAGVRRGMHSQIIVDTTPEYISTIDTVKSLKKEIKEKKKKNKYHRVLATKYNPVVSQCDSDPFTTADLSKINKSKLKSHKLRWIAISRDLLQEYPYGSIVKIKCSNPKLNGYWEVHDTMNSRHKFRIDFLVPLNDKYNFHKPILVDMYKV